jgi:radical SAM-linked protein
MQRYRLTYTKQAAMRYTSNLDMHKLWERALRRAALPLAYSQGFHPQPRITQACPLPLGLTARAELVDAWLEQDLEPLSVARALVTALPAGIVITAVETVDLHAPSLPTQIVAAEYIAVFLDAVAPAELAERVAALLAAPNLPRRYRERDYDLRPLGEEMQLLPVDEEGRARLALRLATREGATGRVEEVIAQLGYDPFDVRTERTRLVFQAAA